MASDLCFGPLPAATIHLCVDMQNVFAPGAPWSTPWFDRVLPCVQALAEAQAARTVFTRFIPPRNANVLPGSWRRFYEKWSSLTRDRIDLELLELAPSLARLVPPARVLDKSRYSPFHGTALAAQLRAEAVEAVVVSGTETDVCVLAAILDAVDLGLRVVVARDAVCSSTDATHDALMKLYHHRFSTQIEVADTAQILDQWKRR